MPNTPNRDALSDHSTPAVPDVTVWAQEVRGMLRTSAAFDPHARIFALVNALESNALSYKIEAEDLRAENERLRSENASLRWRLNAADVPCGCKRRCGDDGDIDGPGTCKDLPMKREPLVEIVMVPRSRRASDEGQAS